MVRTSIWFPREETIEELAVVLNRFEHAPVDGRNYVMVHGVGVTSAYFEPLATELADAGPAWLVDLPGYGASPKPDRDVTLADHARILGATLDAAGIENPVLIGHSWGCQVITELVDQRPDISDRLVLLAPTINPARRQPLVALLDLLRNGLVEPPRSDVYGLYNYFFTGRARYFLRQIPHMLGDRIEVRLARIATPSLIVVGDRDPIVPHDWAEKAATLLENGRLEVVPGAHVIMFTAAAEIAGLIESFVAAEKHG